MLKTPSDRVRTKSSCHVGDGGKKLSQSRNREPNKRRETATILNRKTKFRNATEHLSRVCDGSRIASIKIELSKKRKKQVLKHNELLTDSFIIDPTHILEQNFHSIGGKQSYPAYLVDLTTEKKRTSTVIMLASVTLKRSLQQISNAKTTARRSLSQAAALWEQPAEAAASSDDSATNNGIIRFTMTPKPQQQPPSASNETIHLNDPLFDRTAAAEQMSKQMKDSYYYASFQAKEV